MSSDNSHLPSDDHGPGELKPSDDLSPHRREALERLVETMLPEALGFRAPPDLAIRVRKRAVRLQWMRRAHLLGIAAVLMLALGTVWKLFGWGGGGTGPIPGAQGSSAKRVESRGGQDFKTAGTNPAGMQLGGLEIGEDVTVLHGRAGELGSVLGTDESGGEVHLGPEVKLAFGAWTTVRMLEQGEVELLEGNMTCAVAETTPAVPLKVRTLHGISSVQPGSSAYFRMVGKYFEKDPEATQVVVRAGSVAAAGAWGTVTISAGDMRYLYATGPVDLNTGQRQLYPPTVPLPPGDVEHVGPIWFGVSGWTIRTATGDAYVVVKPPDFIDEGGRIEAPRTYNLGWIYRVKWRNGELVSAEPLRPPARKYR